jgi:hypothetical protein
MACSSGLSSLVGLAAGAFIENGGLEGVFGDAPISSELGVPIEIDDFATGETISPTLATVGNSINTVSNQLWKQSLDTTILAMDNDPSFTSTMTSAWNNIGSNLSDTAFFDAIGGFANNVNDALKDVVSGISNSIKQTTTWVGETIGGSGEFVDDILTGDPKKYGTIVGTAVGYVQDANSYINAAANSGIIGTTFTGMNNIISGDIAGVNQSFGGFGAELVKLGGTLSLNHISDLGVPGQLLSNLAASGSLGPMLDKLAAVTVSAETANAIGANIGGGVITSGSGSAVRLGDTGLDLNTIAAQGASLPPQVQKGIFQAFESLAPTELSQVKGLLNNTQPAITQGKDLFDPTKWFPETFESLTAPIRTNSVGFRGIYQDNTGAVNDLFNNLGDDLKGIIPDDLAVANGALARSLQQVKGITETDTVTFGNQVQDLETLKGLTLLENQSVLMTESVKDYWTDTYTTDATTQISLGTGDNGQLKVSDVIGFSAGYNSAAPLKQNADLLATVQSAGDLTPFTQTKGVYDTINEFVAGTFGPVGTTVTITAGYVGAGTYTGATASEAYENAFINGIIPATKTICESFGSNTNVQKIVTNSRRWNEQLAREYLNQTRIDNQDLASIQASDDVALSLATSLNEYGLQTSEGDIGELLERVVNFNSIGGQAVIAAMREARNISKLNVATIQNDASLDTTGITTAGTLSSSTYTQTEANNLVIRS